MAFIQFLITFREALEAALIIGIILAYLAKVGKRALNKYVLLGSGLAVATSSLLGIGIFILYGELSGESESIFEGTASLTATVVLTSVIFWMARNASKMKGELQQKVEISISRGQLLGISAIAFIAVFREGLETVLFMAAVAVQSPEGTALGVISGLLAVLVLTLLMLKGIYRLNLKKFFRYTSAILIVFAAGLTAYGVHEFNEIGVIPPLVEHVWDINPPQNPDGSYPLLHENGDIGSVLKSLVGYNGNPSLSEVIAYVAYWITVGGYALRTYWPGKVQGVILVLRRAFGIPTRNAKEDEAKVV